MSTSEILLKELAVLKSASVNPAKFPDETFDLFSIPAYDEHVPERVMGSEIGSAKKIVSPGDVMISRIVPHIRRVWIVPRSQGVRQIASSEWIVFRGENVWAPYLRWALLSDRFHRSFMRTVSGVGGSLLRARVSQVLEMRVPVPNLAEQKRIAAILDAADALRAKRRESIAELDKLAMSIFADKFGDPVTNEHKWELLRFDQVGTFTSGGTPSKARDDYWSGAVPWVSPKDMKRSYIHTAIDCISDSAVEDTKLKRLSPGHILIVVRGMILAHTFPVAINKASVCINQDMKAIAPCDRLHEGFLMRAIKHLSPRILSKVSTAAHGTKRFDSNGMRGVLVPVPPMTLQAEFATAMESLVALRSKLTSHLAELDALFTSLQSRAFAGEL